MKLLTFLGAAGTVTGSGFFLNEEKSPGILIDYGMFQGSEEVAAYNTRLFPYPTANISGVVVTHAHLDHCGRLPLLFSAGYQGKIYMTAATAALAEITLLDAAKVGQEAQSPLFSDSDVEQVLSHIVPIEYNQTISMGNYAVTLKDAGHILGSAFVEVFDAHGENGLKKYVFSGDLGNSPEELVRPTQRVDEAQIVVLESTYGDRTHTLEDPDVVLAEEIQAVEASGGVLLIPAFSVERTQEILHKIDHLKKNKKVAETTSIFLDSPMAIKATLIYKQFKKLYSDELTRHSYTDDPFDFPGLKLIGPRPESEKIRALPGTKVIIAGSGMLTGGRILSHAAVFLNDPKTRVLIVGYQAEGTLGRKLLNGDTTVTINNKNITVAAHIRKSSGMSAHADQPRLLSWLGQIRGIKKLFLVHGESAARLALKEKIIQELKIPKILLPDMDQTFAL